MSPKKDENGERILHWGLTAISILVLLMKFSDASNPNLAGLRKSLGGSKRCAMSCRLLAFVTLQMPHRWPEEGPA